MEWIEFEPRPGQRIAFFDAYNKMGQLRAWARVAEAAEGLTGEFSGAGALDALDALCEALAKLVADWDLEDAEGRPLPKPESAEAFDDLSTDAGGEVEWIINRLAERLNPNP